MVVAVETAQEIRGAGRKQRERLGEREDREREIDRQRERDRQTERQR